MDRLKGKVAVITGGNSGVGATVAKTFAKEGAKVVITARREAQLEEVAQEIREAGGEVITLAADISKPEDAERMMEAAINEWGTLDILVNNAGVLEKGLKPIDKVVNEDIDMVLNINTKGTIYCMRAATARMKELGGGTIVNVASEAGVVGNGGAAYASSKAAVIGLTKHTALRFAGQGIRCNAICPGTILTPMVAGATAANQDQDLMGQILKHSDLSVGNSTPQDIANIILFLASDESRSIDGQIIVCDFGATL